MDLYEVVLFLHIGAAIVWVGGATVIGILMGRLEKAQAGPALGGVGAQMEFMSRAVFMPASFLALVAGIALVLVDDAMGWEFEDPWIAIGLAGFLVTIGLGMALIGPTAKKISALAPQRPPGDAEVQALRGKMKRVTMLSQVVLWVVVLDMVVKPGA